MPDILFFSEDIPFEIQHPKDISSWLIQIAQKHGQDIDAINYVFCSDDYLLEINQRYLNHDYYTDIITFDNSVDKGSILADIFISIPRVRENAIQQDQPFDQELNRVVVHGLLHLLGYPDKTEDEKMIMRGKEDACLSLLNNK